MSARFLVDTDVLSVGAPSKARSVPELVEWMNRNSQRLYVSVVTIAEIEDGIAKSRREGATRKAGRLREWLETLVHLYTPRILPFEPCRGAHRGDAIGCGTRPRAHGGVRGPGDRRDRTVPRAHDPHPQPEALRPARGRSA